MRAIWRAVQLISMRILHRGWYWKRIGFSRFVPASVTLRPSLLENAKWDKGERIAVEQAIFKALRLCDRQLRIPRFLCFIEAKNVTIASNIALPAQRDTCFKNHPRKLITPRSYTLLLPCIDNRYYFHLCVFCITFSYVAFTFLTEMREYNVWKYCLKKWKSRNAVITVVLNIPLA